MSRPTIPGDFILLDEAQDTNGVVLELARGQSTQLIAVGDRHQQIYEWRGAQNAMVELPCDLEARLSTSFRFGPNIAGNASSYLALLGETIPLRGNPSRNDRIGDVVSPRATICRTNARLLERLVGFLEKGVKPVVVGGVAEILGIVEAAEKLQAGVAVERPLDFFGFSNWREVQVASEEEGGQELRRWVKLVDDYGCQQLRRCIEGLPQREDGVTPVLSTGHKSKGREWSTVVLEDDFLHGVKSKKDEASSRRLDKVAPERKDEADPAAELRLLYVAATRGMEALQIPAALTDKLDALRTQAA